MKNSVYKNNNLHKQTLTWGLGSKYRGEQRSSSQGMPKFMITVTTAIAILNQAGKKERIGFVWNIRLTVNSIETTTNVSIVS